MGLFINRTRDNRDAVPPAPVGSQFDPNLLQLLGAVQGDLKAAYDQLHDACENGGEAGDIRPLLIDFRDTLKVYLSIVRIQLHDFLLECEHLNDQHRHVVAVNGQEMREATNAITRFIGRYLAADARYDGEFLAGLESVWIILNWRAYKDRLELFPLYRATGY